MSVPALVCLLVAGSCRHAPRPQASTPWQPIGNGPQPLPQAQAACRQQAVAETATVPERSTATKGAGGAFVACMRQRGWASPHVDAPAPARPPDS